MSEAEPPPPASTPPPGMAQRGAPPPVAPPAPPPLPPAERAAYRARRTERPSGAPFRLTIQGVVAWTLALAIVGAAAGFLLAPWLAFRALRAGAEAGDLGALAEIIDYPAVRASLRPQLGGRTVAEAPPPVDPLRDPLSAFRRLVRPQAGTTRTVAADPDPYLTPGALAALAAGRGPDAAQAPELGEPQPFPRYRYFGLNRTRIGVPPAGGGGVSREARARETLFTFQRRGLYDWKLVHIRLPAGGEPAA